MWQKQIVPLVVGETMSIRFKCHLLIQCWYDVNVSNNRRSKALPEVFNP